MIEGESDVINYGEISVMPGLRPGVTVSAGQPIGRLVTVLLKDKGRPRTMLHLERYKKGTEQPIKEWPLDCPQPGTLLNPTSLLLHAMRNAN